MVEYYVFVVVTKSDGIVGKAAFEDEGLAIRYKSTSGGANAEVLKLRLYK